MMRLLLFARSLRDVRPVLLIGLLTLSLAACEAEQEDLVGTWTSEDDNSTLVFNSDGSVGFTHAGETVNGTYTLVDEEEVRLNLPGMDPVAFEFEGDDDFEMDVPGVGEVEYEKVD